jgi:1-acyl-sn-glycerol-3-phosphate acyltransferase
VIRTVWAYLFASLATLVFGSVVVVSSALRVKGRIYSWASRNWSRALLFGSASGVRVHGFDRVDWSRPHVLVTNHTGSFEILALAVTIPVPFRFVVKRELERVPVFGTAWKHAGHISIDRSNRQGAVESLRQASEVIRREGGIIIVFPEGTRSRTGELQPFKKGAFLLAIEAGVPIIPTIVTGSARIHSAGSLRIMPGMMDLQIGDPVEVEGYSTGSVEDLIAVVHGRMREMLASTQATVAS